MDLGLTIFAIELFLLLGGVLYAIIIYFRSMDRTYWEVVIGVGFTIVGEMLALLAVLMKYGFLKEIWWIISFPVIAFITTGVPMALLQEIKHRQQGRKADEAERKHNGEDD